ncbi:MAG: AI-2E family transporter [Clostridia bacterium]|nr:AI-2E family transporter [Clostridia bacterium]
MQKKYFFLFLTILSALLLFVSFGESIKIILTGLVAGLTPVLIAFFLAYVFDHAVTFFEKVYFFSGLRGKVTKVLSVLSGILSIILVIVGIFAIIIPALIENALTFSQNISFFTNKLNEVFGAVDSFLGLPENLSLQNLLSSFDTSTIDTLLGDFLNSTISTVSTLSISLVLSFTVLFEKTNIKKALNTFFQKIFSSPEKARKSFYCIKVVFDGYLYGKLLECALTGVLFTILYLCCSLPYAVFFGLLMAILYVVPYVGGYVSLVPACLIGLTVSNIAFFVILIGGIVLLNLVGTFLSPIIYKNNLNISALTIMSSIVIGGAIAGVVGFLLAPPVASIIKLFLSSYMRTKKENFPKKD